jgi:hypothetical protein
MIREELNEIVKYIESQTGLNVTRNTRKREYVYARSLYFKLAKEYTSLPLSYMGEFVGRDHASAIHNITNVFPHAYKFEKTIKKAYDNFKSFKDNDIDVNSEHANTIVALKLEILNLKTKNDYLVNLINSVESHKRPLLIERVEAMVKLINLSEVERPVYTKEMEGAIL